MGKKTKKTAIKWTGLFKPCDCGMGGGPHHHIDAHTIVPWPEFVRAMKEFAEKTGKGDPDGQDSDRMDGTP